MPGIRRDAAGQVVRILECEPPRTELRAPSPSDPAFIFFTSGSTGTCRETIDVLAELPLNATGKVDRVALTRLAETAQHVGP